MSWHRLWGLDLVQLFLHWLTEALILKLVLACAWWISCLLRCSPLFQRREWAILFQDLYVAFQLVYSLISFGGLYRANLDGWNAFGLDFLGEGAFLLLFWSLLNCSAEMSRSIGRINYPSAVIEVYQGGTLVSAGLHPLQSGRKKSSDIVWARRPFFLTSQRDPKEVCERRNKNIAKRQKEAQHNVCGSNHGHEASGACCSWSASKAVQLVHATVPVQGDMWDISVQWPIWSSERMGWLHLPPLRRQGRVYAL